MQVSKDADALVCKVYATYLERRGAGIAKADAKRFESAEVQALFPKTTPSDVDDTIEEAAEAFGFTTDITGGFELNNETIIYMENRFPNGAAQVAEWLTKIIGLFLHLF